MLPPNRMIAAGGASNQYAVMTATSLYCLSRLKLQNSFKSIFTIITPKETYHNSYLKPS
jgi:hypothetical protein